MSDYTFIDLQKDFPTDEACLEALLLTRFADVCPRCEQETVFHRLTGRPGWSCKSCWKQIFPAAGTIFEKSVTPLTLWFYAIYLFGTSKNGVSAKELARHLGVTYKTAHRMGKLIRSTMETKLSELEEGVTNDLLRTNFLSSVNGTYHYISAKYFKYYLAEFMFRHENRGEPVTPLLLERVMSHGTK